MVGNADGVQHFGAGDMFVELVVGKIDAGRVDENVNHTRFGSGVVYHLSRGLFKGAAPGGEPSKMVHLEAWVSVVGIQGIRGRSGACGSNAEDEYWQ